MDQSRSNKKYLIMTIWLLFLITALYLFFFHGDYVKGKLSFLFSLSLITSSTIYLILGCLRGFTLIPSTNLIILGFIFLPTWPLYILTMIGIMSSSLIVYYFSEYLGFDKIFENKHAKHIEKVRNFLQKRELPIVVLWSFLPFMPTDVMCYVCGTLRVNVYKFFLGVLIGEGVICFIYIFLAKNILHLFNIHLL